MVASVSRVLLALWALVMLSAVAQASGGRALRQSSAPRLSKSETFLTYEFQTHAEADKSSLSAQRYQTVVKFGGH